MPIAFPCPSCRGRVSVSRRYAGRTGRCPKCHQPLRVPTIEQAGGVSEHSDVANLDPAPGVAPEDWNREYRRVLSQHGLVSQQSLQWAAAALRDAPRGPGGRPASLLDLFMHYSVLSSETARKVHQEAARALGEGAPGREAPRVPPRPPASDSGDDPAARDPGGGASPPSAGEGHGSPPSPDPEAPSAAEPRDGPRATGVRRPSAREDPDREDAEYEPCEFCYEPIRVGARKCKHCGEFLDESLRELREPPSERLGFWDRSVEGAHFVALLGAIFFCPPVIFVCSILGMLLSSKTSARQRYAVLFIAVLALGFVAMLVRP